MARQLFIFTGILMFSILVSCNRDPLNVDISGIDLSPDIVRFDRELFSLDPDSIDQSIGGFYDRYEAFFDVYNVHILNIGPASQRYYPTYLSMFINDPMNREVFNYTNNIFEDMSAISSVLEDGFKRYIYHYPDSVPPLIVTYVSGFNQGLFTVEKYIGVGLDQYLGRDCEYYDLLGVADYLQYNKYPGKIPSDVAYAWATALYPYNDSMDNVLNRMIHAGLLMYFVEALLPETGDSTLIGFSPLQISWCERNEKQMWTHLVEEKLLFSNDDLNIRKLIENAPYTQLFTMESPGRAAVWQGWQIVRAYARRNPDKKLPQIMSISDYQTILRESRYNP
jgi:hypothetical protein